MNTETTPAASVDGSVEDLGSRIIGMAGRLAAATCRWLLLVAEFDEQDGAFKYGLPSTARWLGYYCGLSQRTAVEHVRVARTLKAHPALAAAMSAGQVSFSHARAIARVAPLGDARLVENLIMVAEHGTVGQLEELVRGLRTVHDNESEPQFRMSETLSHKWRDDSRLGVSAALDPEHGALLLTALDTVSRREGITRAEALARLAEIGLATLEAAGDLPAPSLRGDEHAAIVVHLDAQALPPPEEQPAGPDAETQLRSAERIPTGPAQPEAPISPARPTARIAGGPGLPSSVAERLACSGRVRTLVFDPRVPSGQGRTPLDVGANRRLVSDKQFRALLLRDGGCAHPGCTNRVGLEAHHVQHWLRGGKTVLANLVLLCRRHHAAHHDGQLRITPVGAGRFAFHRPDGTPLGDRSAPAPATPIEREHPVAATAATTRWDGTRLDLDYAIAALAPGLNTVQHRRSAAA